MLSMKIFNLCKLQYPQSYKNEENNPCILPYSQSSKSKMGSRQGATSIFLQILCYTTLKIKLLKST